MLLKIKRYLHLSARVTQLQINIQPSDATYYERLSVSNKNDTFSDTCSNKRHNCESKLFLRQRSDVTTNVTFFLDTQ